MDWKPIGIVPIDGSRVLLFFPWRGHIAVGQYVFNSYQSARDWTSDAGEALTLQHDQPTHWMQLPPPPADLG